jgi:hypothetical protein
MPRHSSPRAARWLSALLLFASATASAQAQWTWQNPLPQGNGLGAIWASSSSDVYAVGGYGAILHFDGSNWKLVDSSSVSMAAVWGSSPSDVYAVGIAGYVRPFNGTVRAKADWPLATSRS